MKRTISTILIMLSALSSELLFAADWPCYRGDAARTAKSTETLAFPLEPIWVYQPAQAPRPAWPDPFRETHSMDFDAAFEPVVANGLVLLGSSADDCVRALDAKTGALKWRFATGGPVRFAPAVYGGAAYVGSDDGRLYCLDLATGREKWVFRGALNDRCVLGNRRLISRWPMRSGVLVDNGTAYFSAGMWPSEGVFVYAVDAATGKEIWVNDTSGCRYQTQPHGSAAITGVAPQGYLAATERVLLVPTGRSVPAGYDRRNGNLLHFTMGRVPKGSGGAWVAVFPEQNLVQCSSRHTLFLDADTGEYHTPWSDTARRMTPLVIPSRQIRVGDMAIQGLDGAVVAYDASKKEIWRRAVKGEARGLAVADGRLVVSTSTSHIYCFADAVGSPKVITEQPSGAKDSPADTQTKKILSLMSKYGITKGYALLAGASDGRQAVSLAKASDLHVIVVPNEKSQVAAIREFLLDNTALHGSRVSVIEPESLVSSALSPYFANLIIVTGTVEEKAQKDLYRLLRPCGGVMIISGPSTGEQNGLLRSASIPAGEIQESAGSTLVVRGRLEGTFDWNSEESADQRLRLPLEVLWFGPPGPAGVLDRSLIGAKLLAPVAANGRMFQLGENHLFAVDAYNGTPLWKRDIPHAVAAPRPIVNNLAADDQSVYLDFGKVTYQLDAQTGAQQKVYGEFKTPKRFSLSAAQKFDFKDAPGSPGQITLEKTDEGLEITMTVEETEFLPFEGWELFFDFRPAERRVNLFEPGAFKLAIQSQTGQLRPWMMVTSIGAWNKGAYAELNKGFMTNRSNHPMLLTASVGPAFPDVRIKEQRTEKQTTLVLKMSWEEIRKTAGFEPAEFSFAATLVHAISAIGKRNTKIKTWRQSYLFSDEYAGVFNNGWAVFRIPGKPVPAESGNDPLHTVADRADLPDRLLSWGRRPSENVPRVLQKREQKHPLTGTGMPITYRKSYGCSGSVASATALFFRSSTLAYYCFEDNSGIRNFGGMRSSCGQPGNIVPAFGLLIAIEGSSGCVCSYSSQTSLALVNAQHRSNEDWATYDTYSYRKVSPAPGTVISQYHVNLGAPGDRRDDRGELWLGCPRAGSYWKRDAQVLSMPVPIDVNGGDSFAQYRFNADRRPIHKTDRPWLYGSGYRDVRTVDLSLSYFDPYHEAMVLSCEAVPAVDGVLDEACWNGSHAALLPSQNAIALLRYDKDNFYIAYDRRAATAIAGGEPAALKTDLQGRDVPVWEDDCMELHFGNEEGSGQMLHFAVSAGGGRYDGILPEFGSEAEDASWNPEWTGTARATGTSFAVETAIPWSVLESRGLERESMTVNFRLRECMSQKGLNPQDVSHHMKLVDSKPEDRMFTVRLHFAEVDDTKPGERVFDVAIQGRTVIKDLDIRAETGAADTALVKEIKGIQAGRSIHIEFSPADGATGTKAVPLLSAIEAVAE